MSALVCAVILVLSPPSVDPNAIEPERANPEAVELDAIELESLDSDPANSDEAVEVVHLEQRVAAGSGTGGASNMQGRFRIHLDGNLFSFRHQREWFEPDHMPADDIEDVINSVGFGIGQHNFGLGLGYGITDGLVVGVKLGLGFNHSRAQDRGPGLVGPDSINNTTNFVVLPYVEYAFIPGGRFRPFIYVHGGVGGSHFVQTDSDKTGAVIGNSVSPVIGGGGGLHIFIIPQVSVDLFGEVDQYFTLTKSKVEVNGVIDTTVANDYARDSLLTEFSVLAGLSLWFGGR